MIKIIIKVKHRIKINASLKKKKKKKKKRKSNQVFANSRSIHIGEKNPQKTGESHQFF